MGVITVEAAVKTTAVVSFVLPLILLAVPFLDTTFVVLKRLKYKQPVYRPDSEHFHHRMARIGFSSRRTIAYLYAWTLMLAGLALALRFVPYSNHHGHLYTGWTIVMIAHRADRGRGERVPRLRARDPQVPPPRCDAAAAAAARGLTSGDRGGRRQGLRDRRIQRDLGARARRRRAAGAARPGVAGAEQRVGQRQMDQDGVGAEEERGGAQAPIAADGR